MRYPFLKLSDTTAPIADLLKQAALRVIDSGCYLNGPETKAFERELADSVGCKSPAVGVSNGLDALRLIFRAMIETGRLREGDEVLYPANTYIASVMPLSEFGLKGVGVEPSVEDFCMNAAEAERLCTDRTKALLAVHLYGNPCWNEALAELVRNKGLILVEDNAQAIGAVAPVKGKSGSCICGNLGDAAAFSFYPTKNVGALGDAGAVVSVHDDICRSVRALANYGSDRRYHNIYLGYNCRIDEIQAAFLRIKLQRLEEEISRRAAVANAYDKAISNPMVQKPKIFDDRRQVWHQYPILAVEARRDEMRQYLEQQGVGTDIHYAVPPHKQPCYNKGMPTAVFPITEAIADREISLPIANMTEIKAAEIAAIINSFK